MMKFMTATTLSALAAGLPVEAQERPSVAPKNMQVIAPALADYTDRVLYGDVWIRPDLTSRDRSLVTVSALIATGKTQQLAGHLNRALTNGVKPAEIAGAITHLAFYTGWPNAVTALNVVEEVFADGKIDLSTLAQPKGQRRSAAPSGPDHSADQNIAAIAPKLSQLTEDVIFEDLWRRSDLSLRDRSLVTIAALVANGEMEQLPVEVRRGMENGLTRPQIGETLTHLSFYAGLPRATEAAAVAGTAIAAESNSSKEASAERLVVVPSNVQEQLAPTSNFTGSVAVASRFNATGGSRLGGATVSFQPGARTHWHIHSRGQLLVVTKGEGWVQVESEPVRAVKAGDVIWTAPGVRHWHGATPSRAMTHVAIAETLEGESVHWLGPVSDSQYRAP